MINLFKSFNPRKEKVFVIGFNKTGTTSIKLALQELGYKLGEQHKFESLLPQIIKGEYDETFKLIEKAEAFQDIPFSTPNFYKKLFEKYPNAYYILSVRESSETWFKSLMNFHSVMFFYGRTPSIQVNEINEYRYPGFLVDYLKLTFGSTDYNESTYKSVYTNYNNEVRQFFNEKKGKLCVLDLNDNNSYEKMCQFLNIEPKRENFPWVNKTSKN